MKVTWKNTKKKKPCLPALSHFTELPFNHDSSDGTTVRSTDSDQSSQLATQFQTQGDNLAMVLFCFSFLGNRILHIFLSLIKPISITKGKNKVKLFPYNL